MPLWNCRAIIYKQASFVKRNFIFFQKFMN